jgi:hypothetical protein
LPLLTSVFACRTADAPANSGSHALADRRSYFRAVERADLAADVPTILSSEQCTLGSPNCTSTLHLRGFNAL